MAADDRLWADEANELLADGARTADSQALDYDLRSDDIADVRERHRARTVGLLEAVRSSPGNLNA
ncbi:hypothetical protein BRC85_11775 [Halobacteriales archaeon QS_1_69_70]|nr:MAG: hypothetical protein BRC85_11775 [Halobacteriales archaeon QS_1_69_70]